MDKEAQNIEYMAKHLVIIFIQFSPAILIFSFATSEKQEEFFQIVKTEGKLPEANGGLVVASAYKANVEEEYKSVVQIIQSIPMPKN